MDAKSIIQKNLTLYLDYVRFFSDNAKSHHFSNKNGGFPVFTENNKEYYEQAFFDELIENSIWRFLVNGIIRDLFSQKYDPSSNLICEWTNMNHQLTTSYVEVIEKKYALEFILVRNGEREGYRYTNCYYNEDKYNKVFEVNKLDRLIVLDFSSEKQSSFLHPLWVPKNMDSKVMRLSIKDFFAIFFSEQIYSDYLSAVRGAVRESYKYVGIQTVRNLNTQYLPYFLESEIKKIKDFPYTSKSYVVFNALNYTASNWYGNGIIPPEDITIIHSAFFDQKRYLALTGKESFAKSFITSEYLYLILKDNNQFDFTAIVSGYLKSIEQLLYRVLNIAVNDGHSEDVWIQSKKRRHSQRAKKTPDQFRDNPNDRNRTQVKVFVQNQDCFDTTFAALVHMLKDYDNGWSISTTGRDVICALLLTYCDECRNEHFHKDNINTLGEVDIIRDNTFLLLYYILGGYDFSKAGQNEKQLLGIIDNNFDRVYREIMRFGTGNYYLLQLNSNEKLLVALPAKQALPSYDEDGVITNPVLRFVKVSRPIDSDWHKDNWTEIEEEYSEEKTVILTPSNLPKSIEYIDKMSGETTIIKW